MKKQLSELTAWSHFSVVVNNQRVIGKKINDRVAICQSFTSNDKDYCAPAEFGTEYFHIKALDSDEVMKLKRSGWFNEKFYKMYEEYESILD